MGKLAVKVKDENHTLLISKIDSKNLITIEMEDHRFDDGDVMIMNITKDDAEKVIKFLQTQI